MFYEKPTSYRISTITAIGSISTNIDYEINLDRLYDLMITIPYDDSKASGITYIEYGKKKTQTIYKGFSKKYLINRRKNTETKRFDNQMTIVYKMIDKNNEISNLNTKIFKNGKIQITGIKYQDQGKEIISIITNIIHKLYESGVNDVIMIKDKDEETEKNDNKIDIKYIVENSYKVVLINSDFVVGFNIKREQLYKLISDKYKLGVSYEPCIYPAVKIKFLWNIINNNLNDGLCHCNIPCTNKKGSGYGHMNCKTITISVFQSGCIIITGAQSIEQIESAYNYINKILYNNVNIIQNNISFFMNNDCIKEKNTIMIKQDNILKFSV